VCVCVCVYVYIYIYICACVCVCVCIPHIHMYIDTCILGVLTSLSPTRKETSSEACKGRARFQQHRDASCHQVFFFPARQDAEGNSRHSDKKH